MKIMQCVTTVKYSFLLNGEAVGSVMPTRGLCQGDPISPYLFIICAEAFSSLLSAAKTNGKIRGVKVSRGAPSISHLLFADDSFIFCRATKKEVQALREILTVYEVVSGQMVNLGKSSVSFSRNVRGELKDGISRILGIPWVSHHDLYLGLPIELGRNRTDSLAYVKDRLQKKVEGWKEAHLTQGGKEVLLKAVAEAVPTYAMGVMRSPDGLCDAMEKVQNSFWWKASNESQGIHWMS